MNPLYLDAVQSAVDDYNEWATKKGGQYDVKAAYGELKGIFYNKLASNLASATGLPRGSSGSRSWYGKTPTVLNSLSVDKIVCNFEEGGGLTGIIVLTEPGRNEVADGIREASYKVIYTRDPYLKIIKTAYRTIANL